MSSRIVRRPVPLSVADCVRCGACCVNPRENRREGFGDYVEIDERDTINDHPALLRRYTYASADGGALHLRLAPDGRCLALRGTLGRKVRCEIYSHRPTPCRKVEPGSELCLRYREDAGLA